MSTFMRRRRESATTNEGILEDLEGQPPHRRPRFFRLRAPFFPVRTNLNRRSPGFTGVAVTSWQPTLGADGTAEEI